MWRDWDGCDACIDSTGVSNWWNWNCCWDKIGRKDERDLKKNWGGTYCAAREKLKSAAADELWPYERGVAHWMPKRAASAWLPCPISVGVAPNEHCEAWLALILALAALAAATSANRCAFMHRFSSRSTTRCDFSKATSAVRICFRHNASSWATIHAADATSLSLALCLRDSSF
jgi:hypothetical protein